MTGIIRNLKNNKEFRVSSNKPFVTLVPEVEVVVLALSTAIIGIAMHATTESPAVIARAAQVLVSSPVHVPLVVAAVAR